MNNYTEDMLNDVSAILESHDGMDIDVVARAVLDGLILPYVEITPATAQSYTRGWRAANLGGPSTPYMRRRAGLRAALESLGFMVRADS